MAGSIQQRREGAIAYVTFDNRERFNAMSHDMCSAAHQAFIEIAADPKVRAVVIEGAGEKAFIAGADISEFDTLRDTPEAQKKHAEILGGMNEALLNISVPVVARIRGWCLGGGMAVALCCDLRISSSNSRFGIPAAKLGLGYAYRPLEQLCEIVGHSNAREILFTGNKFSADEAFDMGLVNRVFADSKFDDEFLSYIENIAANAPLTLKAAKFTLNQFGRAREERDLETSNKMTQNCDQSDDFIEGRHAFMEKRKPVFNGR